MSLLSRQPAVLCLLLLSLAGCGGGGGNAAVSQNRHFGPLEFALTTTKATFARGERIPLTFQVKNNSSQTVTARGGNCEIMFKITRGSQAINPGFGCNQSDYRITLAPNETHTWDTTWDQTDNTSSVVASGLFTIKIWLTAGNIDGSNISEAEAEENLAANPIQITVTP